MRHLAGAAILLGIALITSEPTARAQNIVLMPGGAPTRPAAFVWSSDTFSVVPLSVSGMNCGLILGNSARADGQAIWTTPRTANLPRSLQIATAEANVTYTPKDGPPQHSRIVLRRPGGSHSEFQLMPQPAGSLTGSTLRISFLGCSL
jgi:hypothetical protein